MKKITDYKTLILSFLILTTFNISISSAQLVLKSKFIKITMDKRSGGFTIKRNILKDNDYDHNILGSDCWPPSTFASVRYNDIIYKLGNSAGSITESKINNNSLVFSWKINSALISQIISIKTKDSKSKIDIDYIIENNHTKTNNIDIRLCMDTEINKNKHYYITSGKSVITREMNCYNIFDWYCIDSIANPGLYLRYNIKNTNQRPEKFIFSSWDKFYENSWDFDPDNKKPFYNSYTLSKSSDSAIGIFWNNQLSPFIKKICSIELEVGIPKVDESALAIEYSSASNNYLTNSIFFLIRNKCLKDLENIKIKFKTDRSNEIILAQPEITIENLPFLEKKNIRCPYSINISPVIKSVSMNTNITTNINKVITFRLTAQYYSFEKVYEKEIKISVKKEPGDSN